MSSTASKLKPGSVGRGSEDPVEVLVGVAKAVGDRLRADILRVLHQDSYAVAELCELFDVPQPALSHHLKILLHAGLVARRREGNSIFYRRSTPGPAAAAFFPELDAEPVAGDLAARIARIHEQRTERSAQFFEEKASEIRAQQAEICEAATYQEVVLEMVDDAIAEGARTADVLEVGPGSGTLLAELASRYNRAAGVERSRTMLDAARAAVPPDRDVRFSHQDFMSLPSESCYDALIAAMVVHHQASPAAFFAKAAAVLRPGGHLLVAELCLHDQEWARSACGDTWLGFEPDELRSWAERAGFVPVNAQFLAQKNGFRVQVLDFRIPLN